MAKVKITQNWDNGWSDRESWAVNPANTNPIVEGQLLMNNGSQQVEAMDLVTEDATFVGVAFTGHSLNPDDFRDRVTVLEKCEIQIDVVSADYIRGAPLKYSSGDATTDQALVADGGSNTIA